MWQLQHVQHETSPFSPAWTRSRPAVGRCPVKYPLVTFTIAQLHGQSSVALKSFFCRADDTNTKEHRKLHKLRAQICVTMSAECIPVEAGACVAVLALAGHCKSIQTFTSQSVVVSSVTAQRTASAQPCSEKLVQMHEHPLCCFIEQIKRPGSLNLLEFHLGAKDRHHSRI